MSADPRAVRFAATLLLAGAIPAQAPPSRDQALIDEFVAVMPRDPTGLRQPELRKQLAPKALPVLRRIRDHVAANAHSELATRVREFVVYALVLGEPELRETLVLRSKAGDREADLLVCSAEVISAADAAQRGRAVAACAVALRETAADGKTALDATVAGCAVQCLAVAADLTEAEAKQLAAGGAAESVVQRLREVAERAAHDPRRRLGKPFAIEGTQLGGATFRTASLLGKVVLVDFWATWCGPCVRSLPDLVRLRAEHGDGLAIVGISCDSEAGKLEAFLAEHPEVDWPQLFAAGGKRWHPLATEHGVDAIPRLFLVDRKGVLRSVDAKQDLDALVRRYLVE